MTAQVAVMNKLGMALASDSAVTLQSPDTPDKPKIFQSADKLFLLSEGEPIAAMVFGDFSFEDTPWEVLVKRYRSLHGNRSYATVAGHAKAFLRFLERDRHLCSDSRQRRRFRKHIVTLYAKLRETIENRLTEELTAKGPLKESAIRRIVGGAVKNALTKIRQAQSKSVLHNNHSAVIQKAYAKEITDEIHEVFQKLPMTAVTRRSLRQIAGSLHAGTRSPEDSGLVVAGFGRSEVFPALVHVRVNMITANLVNAYDYREATITNQPSAGIIIPLAQPEMVMMFMEGIEPRVLHEMIDSVTDLLREELPDVIANSVSGLSKSEQDSLRETLAATSEKPLTMLLEGWKRIRNQNHTLPIMSVVAMLPKDELAAMAESLVNLTVLRRHTSTDTETVGGPIDVAVITKGDGFVWIKRKHYFSAELNPRYVAKFGARNKR